MKPESASLAGRVALVTGAGAGIGKGVALALAAFGARVAVLELDPRTAEHTAAEIAANAGEALALPADARDPTAVSNALEVTSARFGPVDVLVNNAGGTFAAPFLDSREKGWDALWRANAKSVMHCTQLVARGLVAAGHGGSVVNVVSIEAGRAAPLYAAYADRKSVV